MGVKTGIEWTDASVNFWKGCRKVSQGCKNCYMFTDQKRYGQDPNVVSRCQDATFYAALKWKEPKKIFTCSWSDFFIEEADEWRGDAWDVIRRSPQHTWQILTKRPERILDHFPPDWGDGWPNVWLGTSVENQKAADERILHLLNVPACVRFLSCEPLLEAVDLSPYLCDFELGRGSNGRGNLHWVICGGESGTDPRPMHPNWVRGLRDQCVAAQMPFFFKQWGNLLPFEQDAQAPFWNDQAGGFHDGHGLGILDPETAEVGKGWHLDSEFSDVAWKRVSKKSAGRLLDGREWNEMPEVSL